MTGFKQIRWPSVLWGAIPCIVLYLLWARFLGNAAGANDPDRYFHLALARESVASGKWFLHQIPQITGLAWDQAYPDKEFLFHAVNRVLYAWGGEPGVLQVIPVAASLILVALTIAAQKFVKPWIAMAIIIVFLMLDPWMMIRLCMLRPHLLAILFFCGLLISLLARSVPAVFAFGLLYSWSYHGFYIPLALLWIFYCSEFRWNSPRLRFLLWGGLGLITGLIVNPHFPGNLWMSLRHASIALFEAKTAQLDFGLELFPWSTERFLRNHLPFFLLIVSSPFLVLMSSQNFRESLNKSDFLWLWASSLFFLALAAQNPRALEYAVPLGVVLLALVAQILDQNRRRAFVFLAAFLIVSVPKVLPFQGVNLQKEIVARKGAAVEELITELRKLPRSSTQVRSHVFNVEWDNSPYIYHARPDFGFLDILDPSFLSSHDAFLHSMRWKLREGRVPDPWGVIQSVSGSKFLVSRHPDLNSQLATDVHFKRVYPLSAPNGGAQEQIFELLEVRDPHFVLDWKARVALRSGPRVEADHLLPIAREETSWKFVSTLNLRTPIKSAYLDLRTGTAAVTLSLEDIDSSGGGISCAHLRPAPEELRKQGGKSIIALGGGRSLRVWLNGKKLFRSIAVHENIALMDRLVKLDRPLSTSDRLDILACSKDSGSSWGAVLSFWTPQEIEQLCRERGWKPAEALADSRGWPGVGDYRETCLGSYIRAF